MFTTVESPITLELASNHVISNKEYGIGIDSVTPELFGHNILSLAKALAGGPAF